MFSLRNKGGKDCVAQLCRALSNDTSSALLRHEVAYVLGQMQHPDSVEALETSLRRVEEHSMVRHESAEALGAIEGRWLDCERILEEFSKDDNVVVRESCLVALDAADYWGHNTTDNQDDTEPQEKISFAQQKSGEPPNRILVNHFNVEE
jgi:deoxyhypusine monooxygenase